ncbi:MAG: ElyC/SanA/YdcF family protein [Patescibacteria group bacterium]
MTPKKIGIIIQARMGSKRLPGKVYRKILNKHLLEWVIIRAKKSQLAEKLVVATPNTKEDSILLPIIKRNNTYFFQGSLHNVLDRFIGASKKFNIDPIIRITGDCPLIDPCLIDQSIREYSKLKKKPDYFLIEGYPFGLGDIEIIKLSALEKSLKLAKDLEHLEHVVSFISERPDLFEIIVKKAPKNLFRQDIRVCVDELPDLFLVRKIAEHFKPRTDFTAEEILKYLEKNSKIAGTNKNIKHNYIIPKNVIDAKKEETFQEIKKIIKQKNPVAKKDWDLIIILSGPQESIADILKNNKRNEDKDRFETALKVAKQVAKKRKERPIVYYNGSDEQNDNLRGLIKKGFLQRYDFPEEKIIVSENFKIKNTEDQFKKMSDAVLQNKRKIIIVSSAYHLPRVKNYISKYQKKFNPEKIVLYPAEPKIFELKKAKEEAEKIAKYFK